MSTTPLVNEAGGRAVGRLGRRCRCLASPRSVGECRVAVYVSRATEFAAVPPLSRMPKLGYCGECSGYSRLCPRVSRLGRCSLTRRPDAISTSFGAARPAADWLGARSGNGGGSGHRNRRDGRRRSVGLGGPGHGRTRNGDVVRCVGRSDRHQHRPIEHFRKRRGQPRHGDCRLPARGGDQRNPARGRRRRRASAS